VIEMICAWCKHPGVHAEVVDDGKPPRCTQCDRCTRESRVLECEPEPDDAS
jgi:hypothetical protein